MDSWEKGRKAEKIVSNLFMEAGFKVVKYGYEHTLPKLADKKNPIVGAAAEYIRHQPDFIVINGGNEAFFIEVKHRSNRFMPTREVFPYPSCYIILLTKHSILAQSTKYLFDKEANFYPLTKMPPFQTIPQDTIRKYVKKLRRTLGEETWTGQLVENFVEKLTGKILQEPQDNVEILKEFPSTIVTPSNNWYYRVSKSQVNGWVFTEYKDKYRHKGDGTYHFKGKVFRYLISVKGDKQAYYMRKRGEKTRKNW